MITACRACRDTHLDPVLDLGNLAISDFLEPGQEAQRAPLALVRCGGCGLVQLTHTVDRDRLFLRYFYRSATNPTMVAALRDLASDGLARVTLERGDHVMDLAANDGTLLRMLPSFVRRVGVDPSDVADSAVGNDVTIVHDYFPFRRYPVPVVPQKIIYSAAVLYSVESPPAFVEGVQAWLHPDGVWMLQVSYLPATLRTNNFSDVVHEHLCYFTVRSLARLIEAHGLKIVGLSFNDVNGGSVRLAVRHAGHPEPAAAVPDDDVSADDLHAFAQRVDVLRRRTRTLLERIRRSGRLSIGLGASTKGSTMLAYYDVGPDLLPAIGDRNPAKRGLHTVTGVPIVTEEEARAMHPDYALILPWHFADGIIDRERAHVPRFILPLPDLRVVRATAGARPEATRAAA